MDQSLRGKKRSKQPRILIPVTPESDQESLFTLARLFSSQHQVLLLGVVPMQPEENLSAGTKAARKLRRVLKENSDGDRIKVKPRVRVSYTPWADIREIVYGSRSIELLILDQTKQLKALDLLAKEIMAHPPCDLAIVRGPIPEDVKKMVIPLRGGRHSEKVLRAGIRLAAVTGAVVDTFHLTQPNQDTHEVEVGYFSGLTRALSAVPKAKHSTIGSADYLNTIVEISNQADLIVAGASRHQAEGDDSYGPVADTLLERSTAAVILIKGKSDIIRQPEESSFDSRAISVLVDQWFAENTYHSKEFDVIPEIIKSKKEHGHKISLALPTLNEEKTIGPILEVCVRDLMEKFPLIDEVIVMDSNSSDNTRKIAESFGIPVYIHQDILPEYGARTGKGEALWKSLHMTSGDIVLWTDTDIHDYHPRFVLGLLGPLLLRKALGFVKGFYRRPLKTRSGGLERGKGGRVTELSARPLFNLFYPELTGIIQPLAGEYGGRREVLEQLTFTSGYGVETCMLIEVVKKFGLPSIAQIDMLERIHNNQALYDLSKMSFAILQTVITRVEKEQGIKILEDINRTMKMIQTHGDEYTLQVEEVAERERPPIITLPEYRDKHKRPNQLTPLLSAASSSRVLGSV